MYNKHYHQKTGEKQGGAWSELRQAEKVCFEVSFKNIERFCLTEGEGETIPGRWSSKGEGTGADSGKVNAGNFEEKCVGGRAKRS